MSGETRAVVLALVIALLAVVPVALFGLDRALGASAIATVNVLLIVGALTYMLGVRVPERPGAS